MIEIPDDYAAKGLDGHCCGEWSPHAITRIIACTRLKAEPPFPIIPFLNNSKQPND